MEETSWLTAQTLAERRDALRRLSPKPAWDRALAHERLKEWRDGRALRDEKLFRRRLKLDGLTKPEFLRILGTPPEAIFGPTFEPEWLAEVRRNEVEGGELLFASQAFAAYDKRGILAPYLPAIRRYANKLYRWLSEHRELREKLSVPVEKTLELILAPTLQRIEYYHRSAAILEVNIHRVLGKLEGETPEARFESFRQKMKESAERELVQRKYAVLTRSLQRTLEHWLANNIEFFERLNADLGAIRSAFGIDAGDALSKVDPGSGDLHNRGRSVTIVTFASGKKVLYKPRNLSIDRQFKRLIDGCNERGMDPRLAAVEVIERDGYGWVEFIPTRPCENEAQREEFYLRLGGMVAVLHSLSAVDIHFENIVACGQDPYVIDLETLFHIDLDELKVRSASDLLSKRFRDSVMSIGILPRPVLSGEGKKTFDTSAIGASVNQQAPYKVLGMANMGRDDVSITHIPGWIPSVHNRPSEDETKPVPAIKVLEGFESAYRFLAAHKDELLAADGPIEAFGRLDGRLIARNTQYYGSLHLEAIHPDYLRDALDLEAHWDDLWNDVPTRPQVEAFIPSERPQLADGDVPFFTTGLADSRVAVGCDGRTVRGIRAASGYARAKETIRDLSEKNMARQTWLIRASLGCIEDYTCLVAPTQVGAQNAKCRLGPGLRRGDDGRLAYLELAAGVGRAVLGRLGRWNKMSSSYTVTNITGEHGTSAAHSINTSGATLYEGNAGIAMFLAYLGRETGDAEFTEAARGLVNDMLHIYRGRNRHWNNLSGFIGAPSLCYVLTHLGAIWGDRALTQEAGRIASQMLRVIPDNSNFDLLLGPIGASLAVLPLTRKRGGDALKLAIKGADFIAERADGEPRWNKLQVKRGFSHGLSGVAYAFSELADATGNAAYAREAKEMLAQERRYLADGHWTDAHNYQGRMQCAWCHGASGIALGRLGIYRRSPSAELRRDIEEALAENARGWWMDSQCLCHGSAGNLEPLLVAREFPEFEKWTASLPEFSAKLAADVAARGWRSMLPSQTLSLDLFCGLSGLGYGLLRLHAAERVPSVLLLEGPLGVRKREPRARKELVSR